MVFAFLHSTKNKTFTAGEQSKIDKICRNIDKFTKKKFLIHFNIEENENYGATTSESHNILDVNNPHSYTVTSSNNTTQTMEYTYEFFNLELTIKVCKLYAVNKEESKLFLENCFGDWDYKFYYPSEKLPKHFKEKDIQAIHVKVDGSKNWYVALDLLERIKGYKKDLKQIKDKTTQGRYKELIATAEKSENLKLFERELKKKTQRKKSIPIMQKFDHILLSYNSKWEQLLKDDINSILKENIK